MKKLLLFCLFVCSTLAANAQFSESFFNSLNNPNGTYLTGMAERVSATEVNDGFLGAFIADSAGTNVQFVHMVYNGTSYNTYSSTLPAPYGQKTTAIVNMYQDGHDTYLVVSDYTNAKVGIIHYYDYVYADYADISINLFQTYFNSYWDAANHNIAVYVVNQSGDLMRLLFDVGGMTYQGSLTIDTGFVPQDLTYSTGYWKDYLVSYFTNTESVFYCKGGTLYQALITGSSATVNPLMGNCKYIHGAFKNNPFDVLVVSTTLASDTISKCLLLGNTLVQSGAEPYVLFNMGYVAKYARINGQDVWFRNMFSPEASITTFNNGVQATMSSFNLYGKALKIFKVSSNNKLFMAGFNYRGYIEPFINYTGIQNLAFFMSYGDPTQLLPLCEREASYTMGRFNFDAMFGASIFSNDLMNTVAFHTADTAYSPGTVYNSSFVIAGKDTSGHFRGSDFMIYHGNCRPGPYTTPGLYAQEDLHKYYENFYVDVYMVGNHLQQLINGNSSYIPPKGILNWPANGDPSKGQSQQLAPYVDYNGNGVYEPMLGEYPDFPGTRCLLSISHEPLMNSSDTLHTGFELYRYIYNFDCQDSAMENTVFTRLVVKNKGGIFYDSLLIGAFNDYDIGGDEDDYIASNAALGLAFGYNGDAFDDNQGGETGYGALIPAQAYAILKSGALEADGIDNAVGSGVNQSINGYGFADGIVDNEYWGMESALYFNLAGVGGAIPGVNDDPANPRDNFLFLTSRFKSGAHLTSGGMGLGGAIPAKYSFPDSSDMQYYYGTYGIPAQPWSEVTSGDPPGDRRIMSGGHTQKFYPDSVIVFEGAYILGEADTALGIYGYKHDLFPKSAKIRQYFQSGYTPCGQSFGSNGNIIQYLGIKEQAKVLEYAVYPNPSKGVFYIKGLVGDEQIQVMDFSGRILEAAYTGTQVDLSSYANGLYFIIVSEHGKMHNFKVMKQ